MHVRFAWSRGQISYRIERKPAAANKNAEHVAKIAGGNHFDVFDRVTVSNAAEDDAVNDNSQLFLC